MVGWTAEEDDLLRRAVAVHGEVDHWKVIATHVPGRSNKACRKVFFPTPPPFPLPSSLISSSSSSPITPYPPLTTSSSVGFILFLHPSRNQLGLLQRIGASSTSTQTTALNGLKSLGKSQAEQTTLVQRDIEKH
jgi:hypothetical protein